MKDIIKRNNVKVSGEGRETIMFAHGFIGDQTLWRLIVSSFEKKHRVVLFDYVGSGKSDCSLLDPVKYSRLEGYAEDIIDICTALNLKRRDICRALDQQYDWFNCLYAQATLFFKDDLHRGPRRAIQMKEPIWVALRRTIFTQSSTILRPTIINGQNSWHR